MHRLSSHRKKSFVKSSYVRNFVFGVEDSLVSTVGLVSGIAAAGTPRSVIVLSGIVLIVVEAFSMGVGSFLSQQSEEEFLTHKDGTTKDSLTNAFIMFTSYFFAGFIPMAPYILDLGKHTFWYSILASICTLILLGIINGIFFRVSIVKNALKMGILGGLAISVGIAVGQFVTHM